MNLVIRILKNSCIGDRQVGKTTQKIPTVFKETYGASGKFIDRSNFREFICKE